MEIAEVAERLYAVTPEEFTALRTEQVKAAKAAGHKELAKQIGGLRKPTRSAWLVNLVARGAGSDLADLLDLGAALREAQQSLDGAELRTLSSRRSKAVNALSRRAVELGAAAGYQASDAARQEVSQSLQAALADPEQAELVRRGVLSQPISYGGFGPFDLAAGAAPTKTPPTRPTPEEPDATDETDETDEPDEPELDAAQQRERDAARQAWERAQQELAEAESAAERATTEADALADRLDDLRRELAEAEETEREARRSAREARKRADQLATAERRARELVAD